MREVIDAKTIKPNTEQKSPTIEKEKNRDKLYFDALMAQRDVFRFHKAMNKLRKFRKVTEMPENEIEDYKLAKKEYKKHVDLFLASLRNLNEEDDTKISELTSLSKVEAELSKLEKPVEVISSAPMTEEVITPPTKKENTDRSMTMSHVDRMIQYSRDTARPLELAYWESQKQAIKNKYYEKNQSLAGLAEINKMFDFAKDTGRPLELAYWETRRQIFEHDQDVWKVGKEEEPVVVPQQSEQPTGPLVKQREKPQAQPLQEITPPQELKVEEKTEDQDLLIEKSLEPIPVELTREEKISASDVAVDQHIVSLSEKGAIDNLLSQEEGPVEIPLDIELEKIGKDDDRKIDDSVEKALELLEPLELPEEVVKRETFLKRIRKIVKNKAVIYISAGIMTFGAIKGEAYKDIPSIPSGVVKVLDKAPNLMAPLEFSAMATQESLRYEPGPYLTAKYIGSNDYFSLETIKAVNNIGMESKASGMYKNSLTDYINNFAETRKNNRFTTLDKHTVRNYIDVFVQIYSSGEQPDSGVDTYRQFAGFLQDNFGAARAYEFALKVSSEDNIKSDLMKVSKDELRKQGAVLKGAIGKSNIFFNQEEGIFNVVNDGKLIDTYTSRAGFMNVPKDASPYFKSQGFGRTPDGTFSISSVEHGYSTLRWKDSFLPYGSEIRMGKTGEVEYKYNDGKWYVVTGPEATYFDQGAKVQPNKSDGALKGFKNRSRGESPLTKADFYNMQDGLMNRWEKNPFGPISYRLAGQAELIHSNPNDSDNILHPSHGCIRLDKEDVKTLESYIGKGVSKIKISSESGKTWSNKS